MVGKLMSWFQKRPTFFMQKTILTRWPDELTRDIGTSAKPMSVLSGPEHPILSQIFPPFDKKIVQGFMTRFEDQRKGFFGMSVFEVDGLLSGLGSRRRKRREPEKIDRKGISIIG